MHCIADLKIKLFADGADKKTMLQMYQQSWIKGFTTNPTLMRKAGISDYHAFAIDIINAIPDRPLSFEVFSDDFSQMEKQALLISSWGDNVYVKIPVCNTKGEPSYTLIKKLATLGVKMNITAIMTLDQVQDVAEALALAPACYISVFAGRIADTGRDPIPLMQQAIKIMAPFPQLELIWASPRELLNIIQANDIGCHIITVTNELLNKLNLINKDLMEFSLETVKMFHDDAQKAGFDLEYA
jgi:transaldolase